MCKGDIQHFQLSKEEEDDKIRFGHFASSSINEEVAEGFRTETTEEKGTLFTIHTCFGVKIQDMSYDPGQKEALIPVHETFTVSQKGNNLFDLQSTERTCSHFNCAYLGGEKNQSCVYNSAARGGIAFPSVLSPSLFGGSIILLHIAALKLFAGF
ncbi:ecto-ADP-ribosyltransferase 5-like [Chelonia mydas]|uniref:ecto-ADP-ribosyltransferase 5-like n=1 Tax=Chelonia mydas TaxID=8469 RepID=UPI001CA9D2DC|nr:ecto-ADP-ribosyltransferase 5-like [Chelonia mydas]